MRIVKHGMLDIEVDTKLTAALDRHPHIETEHQEYFRDYFTANWAGGDVARTIRKIGLPSGFFRNMEKTTERQALELICQHATAAIYREYHYRIAPEHVRAGRTEAKLTTAGSLTCAAAKRFDGKVVSISALPVFPLATCTADACFCGWQVQAPNAAR